jgi:hypothetical protein
MCNHGSCARLCCETSARRRQMCSFARLCWETYASAATLGNWRDGRSTLRTNVSSPITVRRKRRLPVLPGSLLVAAAVETLLIYLGRSYGSTTRERMRSLPGDHIVAKPEVVTNHAITIEAPPESVWPWLTQMGWHRAGWYTARWVDRLLFPENWPSADRLIPELQDIKIGSFIPDGSPETKCGFVVEELDPGRVLVLHSTSHVPGSWRTKYGASLNWSWTFSLIPLDKGGRTRFHFRSRWMTKPWWFTLFGWLIVVPADFVMSRDMLHGVKERAERAISLQKE